MKHFKFLAPIAIGVSMTTFLFSCNSGDEKKVDEPAGDSSAVKATAPVKPANLMVVMHKVANFDKWKTSYESSDSLKNAYGVHNYVLARGVKDTNMVMVVVKMDDAVKAKELAALPALKALMQKGGVIGAPTISFLDVQMQDNSENTTSTRVMVTHKVKDYDAWKKVFDEDKPNRINAGFTDRLLAYDIGDNHKVSMVLLVSDMAKAEAFSKSPELKAKMEAGGVEGPPSFFYYTIAKKY
jgi:hypothetical protein